MSSLPGDPLSWQGSFEGNNSFYLIVKSRSTAPSFYALNVTGDVAFPSTLVLSTDTQTAVAAQPAVSSEEMGLTVETPAAATVSEPATTQLGYDAASAIDQPRAMSRFSQGSGGMSSPRKYHCQRRLRMKMPLWNIPMGCRPACPIRHRQL